MLEIDHIVVSAETLDQGTAYVADTLGVTPIPGGKHARFGTHNNLFPLGDVYLEVISVDPSAPKPVSARWFGLDHFSGPPRITNWVCRTEKPRRVIGKTLPGTGEMTPVSRGDLNWQITVSKNGDLPLDGYGPAIIDWMGSPPPSLNMNDLGCRVETFSILHPHAITLRSFLSGLLSDERLILRGSEAPKYELTLSTPSGTKTLS
jgi:hypothetical protein